MRIPTLALSMLLVACATSSPEPRSQRSATVVSAGTSTGTIITSSGDDGSRITLAAPADDVWKATAAAYAALGIEAGVIDAAGPAFGARSLVTSRISGDRMSRLVSCGSDPFGAPAADSYEVSLDVTSSVRAVTGGAEVVTWLTATARPRGTSANAVQCSSRGRLERRINEQIAAQLVAAG